MQNLKRKISKIYQNLTNKRHLRADVLSLLSSALRPRLLDNRGSFGLNVAKIVALSTILGISGLFSVVCSSSSVFADSLTLTIPSSPLSLDLNPSVNNGFATTSGSFNVKTDNELGYTVSIKSKNESSDNSLINDNNKLTSITEATTEDNFKNDPKFINMWGWLPNKLNSEDNTSYQIAPGQEEIVLDKTEEASSDTGTDYNISLGARVAIDSASGTYNNNFIISVTANKPKLPTLQDWNGCNELVEDDETYVTLQDSRDGNIYNVAKLKDGKCWMLEDLKLGGESEITLTPDNSDITNEYILPTVNQDDFGNLYTYNVATANTGGDFTPEGQNAPGSICPKGWRLPVGAPGNEFDIMANSYTSSASLLAAPIPHFSPGYYYSSTSKGSLIYADIYEAYYFRISDNGFGTGTMEQINGLHIRCISRDINEKPYDIFFDSNRNGTAGTDVIPQHQAGYTVEDTIKINSKQPTHASGDFIGWCTSDPGLRDECPGQTYQPDAEYPLNNGRSITLYAIWKINKIYSNIYYNLNGGSASGLSRDYFTVTSSSPARINSKVPTKSNYQFMGWCDEDNSADMSSCPGNILSTGEVLPLSFYLNRGSSYLYLYAIWERV